MKVDIDVASAAQFATANRKQFEDDLKRLVDIPSVSADPAHKGDIERCAAEAVKQLQAAGFKAEAIKTRGNPVVVGELITSPGSHTVTVYNHMDVQPADPSEWKYEPFTMKVDGERYLGRGATDDKGPALTVLYAARYVQQEKVPINIKFIWELEEEIGSPNFEQFLKENKDRLSTDSVVVSDTIWISRDRPAIGYGLRGLQGFEVILETGDKDVHSGLTGGLARNPIGELAQLIAECYDARTGEVKIPGFYDGVRTVTQDQLDDFLKSGFSTANFKTAHELKSLRTNDDKDGARRIWAAPTFEVHGITGGYHGPGVKTIVPHRAQAKISMRVVPDQDPAKLLKLVSDFMKARVPDIEIVPEGTLYPYLGESTGPYAEAGRQAMKDAFGKDAAFVREGGSIGAIVSMQNHLKAPILLLGLSLPEHGYHAKNEYFDWQQAAGGMKLFARYFSLLAQLR